MKLTARSFRGCSSHPTSTNEISDVNETTVIQMTRIGKLGIQAATTSMEMRDDLIEGGPGPS